MQQYSFEHFQSPGHTGFACILFIDEADPFIPTAREDYWRQTLKTLAPHGLNIEESVCLFGLYLLPCTDIFKYYWCQVACIRTTILGLDSGIRGGFGALSGISNGVFCQSGWRLQAVDYFCRAFRFTRLTESWIRFY